MEIPASARPRTSTSPTRRHGRSCRTTGSTASTSACPTRFEAAGSGNGVGMTTSADTVPNLTLRDDVPIPQLGFGVFQVPPPETTEIVLRAFEAGYRHIDTAAAYQNEAQVGQAFRASGLDRDDVFITTKCFNDSHGFEQAKEAFRESLDRLERGFVGPHLIHPDAPPPQQHRA